ncbi:bile acid:sodium symporter family protein [Nannocystis bainbridge]|uniref:Bile acid:sodium symporter family protein n=1 Tax=Nannocystis bainbridge TaxID=2995303 RepID=A0ABT5EB45_9BACT|nr:bile acid:sodium symporter family protein [Nannocystis bainbridge]MDC0723086.1 bile acid:sodium symporter family protein [Nannocystis bainbridge]
MTGADLDRVVLAFEPGSLAVLNVVLALVMVGVALDLRPADFASVLRHPRAAVVGLLGQVVVLPALTFALVSVLDLPASVALGMILVAACPGGNMSNFITHLARGNTELSVTMTAIGTVLAVVTTPLNLAFWSSMSADTAALVRAVELSSRELVTTVLAVLGAPLALGMLIAARRPRLASRLRAPFKLLSLGCLALFIVIGLSRNAATLADHWALLCGVVALHNAAALLSGWLVARTAGLPGRDRRAIAIEVGIQNAGLAMVLAFDFFPGLGGTAMIAAWWGVWHLIAGLSLAFVWRRRALREEDAQAQATTT